MSTDPIINFPRQFAFEPVIKNAEKLSRGSKWIVAGMGGSHLAADILVSVRPDLNIIVHTGYGLPELADMHERVFIASSYSGNTEETLDALDEALRRGMSCVIISKGGRLIERAQTEQIPFIEIPDTGIEARSALGFGLIALAVIIGDEAVRKEIYELSHVLSPEAYEKNGKTLAESLKGFVPVIYASSRNAALAWNWKIKFNESPKIPAFLNVFPELNHNEMTGFSTEGGSALGGDSYSSVNNLVKKFRFIFLQDTEDHPRIIKRMEITRELLEKRGFAVESCVLEGASRWERIFNSLMLAEWTAYHLALSYGVEPWKTPMVEEFKSRMRG